MEKLTVRELKKRCKEAGIEGCEKKRITKGELLGLLASSEERAEDRIRLSNPDIYNIISSVMEKPLPIRSAEFRETSAWPIVEDELVALSNDEDVNVLEIMLNSDAEEIYTSSFFEERIGRFVERYPILLYSLIVGFITKRNKPKSRVIFALSEVYLKRKWPELAKAISLSFEDLLVYRRSGWENLTDREHITIVNYKPRRFENTAYVDLFIELGYLQYPHIERGRPNMFNNNPFAFVEAQWTNERVSAFTSAIEVAMKNLHADIPMRHIFNTNYLKILHLRLFSHGISDRILLDFLFTTFNYRVAYSDRGNLRHINITSFPAAICGRELIFDALFPTLITTINYAIYIPGFADRQRITRYPYPQYESLEIGIDPILAAFSYHILRLTLSSKNLLNALKQNASSFVSDIVVTDIARAILLSYVCLKTIKYTQEELALIYSFVPSNKEVLSIEIIRKYRGDTLSVDDVGSLIPQMPYFTYNETSVMSNRIENILAIIQ